MLQWILDVRPGRELKCTLPQDALGGVVEISLGGGDESDLQQLLQSAVTELRTRKIPIRVDGIFVHCQGARKESAPWLRRVVEALAEWGRCDRGVILVEARLGKSSCTLSEWLSDLRNSEARIWRHGDYAQLRVWRQQTQSLDAWMSEFQRASEGAGWLAGLASTSARAAEALPLPVQRRRTQRWKRLGWASLWAIALGILLIAVASCELHVVRAKSPEFILAMPALDSQATLPCLQKYWELCWKRQRQQVQRSAWLAPGFRFSRDPRADSLENAWLLTWRTIYLQEQETAVKRCMEMDPSEPVDCELRIGDRVLVTQWLQGFAVSTKNLRIAWASMLADQEMPMDSIWESWLQQSWSRAKSNTELAFMEQAETHAKTLGGTLSRFVQARITMITVRDLRSQSLLEGPELVIPSYARAEVQGDVENLFAIHPQDPRALPFLDSLRRLQQLAWQQALAKWIAEADSLHEGFSDSLRKDWKQVQTQLGISTTLMDSSLVDVWLAPYWHKHFAPSLRAWWNSPWRNIYPLRCDIDLPDADPDEILRWAAPTGIWMQWMEQHHRAQITAQLSAHDSNFIAVVEQWRSNLLDPSGAWLPRRLHWELCAVPNWKIRWQVDSAVFVLSGDRDSCVQGDAVWPQNLRSLHLLAEHPQARWVWNGEGIFALPRLVKAWGTWDAGQGSRIQIPLRTSQYQSNLNMRWQEHGAEAMLIRPCALALPSYP